MIIGKDHPVQIRSNGLGTGTTIRVRGADGEWCPLPSVTKAVITIDGAEESNLVLVQLTMFNVEIEVESETVTVTHHEPKGA